VTLTVTIRRRFLDLADELAAASVGVAGRRGRAHADPLAFRRHRDLVVVESRHVEPQLAPPAAVRVLELI